MVGCAMPNDLDDILPLVGHCSSGNDLEFYFGVIGSNLGSFVASFSFCIRTVPKYAMTACQ